MTEKEFWRFLKKAWKKGREPQVSAVSLNGGPPGARDAGGYIGGHEILPRGYQLIPAGTIAEMGELLFEKRISRSTKEAVMMILAHHGCPEALRALVRYAENPDKGEEVFAELALQECEMWAEDWNST